LGFLGKELIITPVDFLVLSRCVLELIFLGAVLSADPIFGGFVPHIVKHIIIEKGITHSERSGIDRPKEYLGSDFIS